MTPDERNLLQGFLRDLVQTRGVNKDAEAEAMIFDALRTSPDAAYVLVQHAVMSDQALHHAQDQIAQLQARVASMPVSNAPAGFGAAQQGPWGQPQPAAPQGQWQTPPQPMPAQGQWQTPPQPMPPQGQPMMQPSAPFVGSGPFSSGGGLGNFLRTAGTMAAGVAGGELLFSGVSSLFGGGHQGFGGGFGGQPTEVINNYYDDDNSGGGDDSSYGGDDSSDS